MNHPTQETPLIRITGLRKNYETAAGSFEALKGIDLGIRSEEIVAVVGKSGSGKSTLMNLIAGIDKPTSGEIVIGEQSILSLREKKMARWRGTMIGVVFQFFQLLPTLNILENVMLPMDFCKTYPFPERKERAQNLLKLVGIEEQAYKFPSALSGGQQQRAAIARALANDPGIILADEPTGNLDSATADAVFGLFHSLSKAGKTVIIITHDQDIANRCTRTIRLCDGLIAERS